MNRYLIKTNTKCIVRYSYVVDAENPFDAVRQFVLVDDTGHYDDYEIIQDNKLVSIEDVRQLA